MMYTNDMMEKKAVLHCADLMCAAARTAPKACGIDLVETLMLDGEDKDRLTATMREIASETNRAFFARDAGNLDASHCVVLIGSSVRARGMNCGYCGVENCATAGREGISCAMTTNDLGIAIGSAAAVAMDHRIDNRVLFTAGTAAMRLGLFSDDVKMCFGLGLATRGKNVFFDRSAL